MSSTGRGGQQRRRIIQLVTDFARCHGYGTSVREIADGVGQAPTTVHYHVGELVTAGKLRRVPGKPRTILPADPGRWQEPPEMAEVELLREVAASFSREAIMLDDELLVALDRPYFHMPIDTINATRARRRTLELDPDEQAVALARTRAGYHRAVAGMAQAGNDLVVDYVLSEQWRLLDCLSVLRGLDVVFIGVRCSSQELARREQERGDREPGQAVAQVPQVHAYGGYDIECDTTRRQPSRVRPAHQARPRTASDLASLGPSQDHAPHLTRQHRVIARVLRQRK